MYVYLNIYVYTTISEKGFMVAHSILHQKILLEKYFKQHALLKMDKGRLSTLYTQKNR